MVNQTIHYMIASVVSAAMGLLSAVVFTRLLSPDEYGVYVIGLSTAGIVSALLFTWVRVSALRFQSEGGSVDIRATVFLAYLLSVLASPVAFVSAIHFALDKMLVFHFMGDHAAGNYGASADLVRQIILIPAVSIASATIPLAVRANTAAGAEDARAHLESSFEILLGTILPAVVGVALTSNYLAGI